MGGKQALTPVTAGRAKGTVQHTYPERGFGFIRCTEGEAEDVGQDIFFHVSGLEGLNMGDLLPGTLVAFEVHDVPRGRRAEHITGAHAGEVTHAATERATRP